MLALALVAVACGRPLGTHDAAARADGLGPAVDPAAIWDAFPVDIDVRPLVLASGAIAEPNDGYTTDVAKIAGGNATFVLPADVPAAPATADGYPLLSAPDTIALARPPDAQKPDGAPVMATAVRLGAAKFVTDRGPTTIPAWLVTIPDAAGPIAIAAVAPPARFVVAGRPVPIGYTQATIDPTGSEVTVTTIGAAEGTGPCTADYRLTLIEHHAYVESVIDETRNGGGECNAVGYTRKVTARLRTPLGNRVLVEQKTAAPIIVTPAPGS